MLSGDGRTAAPRWILIEDANTAPTHDLDAVASRLRELLADDPPNLDFDDHCQQELTRFLATAGRNEVQLLPRRLQFALEQMRQHCGTWARSARQKGETEHAD